MTDESWRTRAECAGTDPNRFFPPDGMRDTERARFIAAAQTICAQCPVRGECLTEARATGQHYGVWGGVDMVYDPLPSGSRSYVRTCAGVCGRTIATPLMMQPGYVPVASHGMCWACVSRVYRKRNSAAQVRAKREDAHQEVLRQHRQGIPAEAIAMNVDYSKRHVRRILDEQRETAQ